VTLDNSAGQISVYDPLVIPALPPPPVSVPAPTGLVTSAITASSVTVSWNAVAGTGVTYIPQSAPQGSTTFTSLAETTATSAIFSGLTGSTAYQFRVVALSSGVQSVPSATVSATTGVPTPTGLTTSAITANSVTLNWNAIPGTGVTYIPQSAPQGSTTFTSLPASSATSAVFTGLAATTLYQFRVIAVINGVQSVPSAVVTSTTAVPTPTGLTTSGITSSSVTLTWTAVPGTGVTYIPQAAPQGSTVFTSLSETSATTATFTGLTSSAAYQFRVIAVINGTQSAPSAVVNATTAVFVVPAPTGLTTSGITSTAVTLNWSAVSAPSPTYIPQYATSGSGTFTALPSTASTSATFTSLAASTAYDFRVIAVSGATQSVPSSVSTATTSAAVVLAPTGLATSGITATAVTLTWSAVTGTGITYIPQFALSGATTFTSLASTSSTTANFTGLASNTAYQFRVIAVNSIGTQSSPSAVVTATTLVTPVSAPTGLTASGITATSITLNWSAVAGTGITYIPQIAPQGSSTFTPLPATASLSATFTGLVASTTYQLRVVAVNNVGTQSNPSTAITASTIASAVPTPTGLATSGITSSAVTLSWNAVSQGSGESANGTQVTAAGQPGITNSVGEVWTLVDGGAGVGLQIAVNGVADTNTLQVQKLVYDSHLVWQQNVDGLWWSKTQASAAWTPTSGTSTAPASANTPPVTYIPQRAPQGSTTYTSLASTGATSATFTGLTANTTYQFRVIAVIGGVQSTPATAVTAKTLASAPAGNTPVRLRTAQLTDVIGVNVHLAWQDVAYADATVINNSMTYLGARFARDGAPYTSGIDNVYTGLFDVGVRFCLLMSASDFFSRGDYSIDISNIKRLISQRPGIIIGVEGFNEINLYPVSYDNGSFVENTQNDLSLGRRLQQWMYEQFKADPQLSSIPVLNLTIAGPLTINDAVAAMGDLGPYCDESTWHTYYGNGDQPVGNLTGGISDAKTLGGGKTPNVTETGYYTAVDDLSWGGGGVTEPVQARLTLNIFMEAANLGAKRTYIYELFDDGTAPTNLIEGSFGLMHNGGAPKQSGTAVHNFTTIMADTASNARTFTTNAATLNITGMPSTGKSFLTQKANGTYMLVIWAAPRIWNQSTRSQITVGNTNVTVTLGATVSVIRVYDPIVGTSAVTTVNNTNVVTAGVSDHPIIIEF
jgi:chitodextrinase